MGTVPPAFPPCDLTSSPAHRDKIVAMPDAIKRDIYLHIGLPKTGTTSLQRYFLANRDFYRARGVDYFLSGGWKNNAGDLARLILRDGVGETPEAVKVQAAQQLDRFFETSKYPRALFIGEDFSYLRTDRECDDLKRLFRDEENRLHIILVLRDRDAWWESYVFQVMKMAELGTATRNARAHLDRHGWLTDFDTLVAVLKRNFESVSLLEYNEDMIGTFLDHLGLPPAEASDAYRRNRRPGRSEIFRLRLRYWRKKLRFHLKSALGLPTRV